MKFESFQPIKENKELIPSPVIERIVSSEELDNGVLFTEKLVDPDGVHRDGAGMIRKYSLELESAKHDMIFFPGFLNDATDFKKELPLLAEQTESNISSLAQIPPIEMGDAFFEHEEPYKEYIEQISKAITVAELAKLDGMNNMDIVAHSQGCIESVIMAAINPGMVENLLLVNPAGIIPMTDEELTKQGVVEGRNRLLRGEVPDFDKIATIIEHYELLKASRAGIANFSQNGNMVELIQKIREQGTKVGIIMTDRDALFNITKMREELTNNEENPLGLVLDAHDVLAGDHGSMLDKENIHHLAKTMRELRQRGNDKIPQTTFG